MGVVMFVLVAIVLTEFGSFEGADFGGILIAVAGGFAIAISIAVMAGSKKIPIAENADEPELLKVFMARNLLTKAPLEGAALFNVIAFILEQSVWSLAITGFLVAVMIATFPTQTKLDNFITAHTTTTV